jgi:hypothetical protein
MANGAPAFRFTHEGDEVAVWAHPLKKGATEHVWVFRYRGRRYSTGLLHGDTVTAPQITERVVAVIAGEHAPPAVGREDSAPPRGRAAAAPQRPAGLRPNEVSFPEWVYALQHETAQHITRVESPCPTCGAGGPSARIYRNRQHHCEYCVPMQRVCSQCGRTKHTTQFDVLVTGHQRVESACQDCRRDANVRRYHAAKALPHPKVSSAWCSTCERRRPIGAFYRDNRYVDGVLPGCRQCRNEQWYAYREGKGAQNVEAARAQYEERRGRRRRRSE